MVKKCALTMRDLIEYFEVCMFAKSALTSKPKNIYYQYVCVYATSYIIIQICTEQRSVFVKC